MAALDRVKRGEEVSTREPVQGAGGLPPLFATAGAGGAQLWRFSAPPGGSRVPLILIFQVWDPPLILSGALHHFYDVLIRCRLNRTLLRRGRHLVPVHLLIAAGAGGHLGRPPASAFIMHLGLKRGLSAFSTPPQHFSIQEGSSYPTRGKGKLHTGFSTGTCLFLFALSPLRRAVVLPAVSPDSLRIQSCQSSR